MDLILATESHLDPGGETLAREPLIWIGAAGGQAWRSRPLRFGSVSRCMFKRAALEALDRAGLPWEIAVDTLSATVSEASAAADLAVLVQLGGSIPQHCEAIRHGGALPELPDYCINMYLGAGPRAALAARLADLVRDAYCCGERVAAE